MTDHPATKIVIFIVNPLSVRTITKPMEDEDMRIDKDQVREWYWTFKDNKEAVEIRIVFSDGETPRVMHKIFDQAEAIIDYLERLPARPHHCYWTLNRLADASLDHTVQDSDIARREWLLIDFDPDRPARTSSSDNEKSLARETMMAVMDDLDSRGFPMPIITDSGNGFHMYYKIDAPNDPETTRIVEAFLHALSDKFSDDFVKIDTVVSNPSRISKIPGTWAVKGESTDERPHRMSKIISVPPSIRIVELSMLESYADDCAGSFMDAGDPGADSHIDQGIDEMMAGMDEYEKRQRIETTRKYIEAFDKHIEAGGSVRFLESDWLSLGYAFKSIGPAGKDYFHHVFSHHPDYHAPFAEQEYNRLKPRALADGRHDKEIGIPTFFRWCHLQGIRPEGMTDDPSDDATAFPFDAFPAMIQDLIEKSHASRLKFPKIYTSCGVLCATSCAIGNVYAVEFTKEHVENAVLYMALVGGKGKNKSHPLSMTMRPLQELDDADFRNYQSRMGIYLENKELPKKERAKMAKPTRTRRIVGDITAEALASAMSENPRGLLLYNDELIGWIKAQNQYRSGNGSDAEMWLSLWSGKSHDVTRKTSESYRITRPFVSVCGTIQPTIIPALAENREANGFLDRILFAWPQDIKIEAIHEDDPEMDPAVLEAWSSLIKDIVHIPYNGEPRHVRLSPEAESMYIRWQNAEAEKCNQLDGQRIRKTDDVSYNGIHAKMESYCLRLSLILEVLKRGCEIDQGLVIVSEISPESMAGALRMCAYFTRQAMEIRNIINSSNTDLLAEDKKRLYLELPDEFSTAEGQEIAKRFGFPERTYKRFINDRRYFKHLSRGKYGKIYMT